jgi:hypothetical protein
MQSHEPLLVATLRIAKPPSLIHGLWLERLAWAASPMLPSEVFLRFDAALICAGRVWLPQTLLDRRSVHHVIQAIKSPPGMRAVGPSQDER